MNALGLLLPLVAANPPVTPVPPPGVAGCVTVMTPAGPKLSCPPIGPPAEVLSVRLLAPAGVKVAFRPATDAPVPAPAMAGLRPGYRHTFTLTNLPNHAGLTLYPVVEVVGSLVPRADMNVLEFPTPILFTQGDLDRAAAGVLVTKVIYLEDPTRAVPEASTPDEPLEFTELTVSDALRSAADSGRLVAIVRLGDRPLAPEELARLTIPGTVILPGEPVTPAAVPPPMPCAAILPYDPIAGPKPTPEECITDGGDKGPRLGLGVENRLGGLNPTDVALEFTTAGKRRVTTSNEVCVCSPRFITRRVEHAPNGVNMVLGLGLTIQETRREVASSNVPAAEAKALVRPVSTVARLRPAVVIVREGLAEMVMLTTPRGVVKIQDLAVVIGTQETDEITTGPDQMIVTKSVEPAGPVPVGSVVTFTLKYRNATPYPATDLVLSDSLSGRFEFLPGSVQSDRPTDTVVSANEAGSVIVRFATPGPIPPGVSGTVTFQARVR